MFNSPIIRAHWFRTAALLGSIAIVSGCASSSPYLSNYTYAPQPATVEVVHRGSQQPPLTAMASIVGIRRADEDHHVGPAVIVRLTLENNGPSSATFDPASLQLVTGTLQPFPSPAVTPGGVIDLAPGQRQDVNATFPFPPGENPQQMNLDNLRLRWEVRVADFPVTQTALFQRTSGGYQSAPPAGSDGYMVY